MEYWRRVHSEYSLPYYPNVTMGWDASPRTVQSDVHANVGYPFMGAIGGNTPEKFREALALTRRVMEGVGGPRILNINAWNEWTEGSYLEPDTVNEMGYLQAIKDVFG